MIVHAADAHLGIQRYNKINPETGRNVRMEDFCNSFDELVSFVLETKPDLFLFSGDLFDRVNPTNYIRKFVQNHFLSLSRARIETFVIPGNHETPKTVGVKNPLTLYTNIPHINIILKPFEKEVGKYNVLAIPYTKTPQKHIKPPKKFSILMMHTTVEGSRLGSERFMAFTQDKISPVKISNFDYVAMGHIHKHQVLHENIVYPGSLERYDFREANEKKGFYVFDGDLEFVEIKTRKMEDIVLECEGDGYQITEMAISLLKNVEGKIVRLTLSGNVKEDVRKTIDFKKIKNASKDSLHFVIKDLTIKEYVLDLREEKVLFPPEEELERYLKKAKAKKSVFEKGTEIIRMVEEG